MGFGMAFAAKAQQKMNNHCTPKSRNLELHLTMSVFLLAASLDFKTYWRALLSFRSLLIQVYIYTKVLVRRGVLGPSPCSFRASPFPPVRHRQGTQNGCKGSKKRKKAQKGSKRRSKRLFEPARCRQCARRGCSSLLRCRLCVRIGCSRLLFKITVRKCWARLHCALSHCTLLCFAPCMYICTGPH